MSAVPVTPIRYEWKPGTAIKINPDVAGRELARLASRDQEVVPVTVVEESRADDAPLHGYFEWDNSIAAENWRENEAKYLIRSLVVIHVRNDTEDELPPTRAYVSVVDEPGLEMYAPADTTPRHRHYVPVVRVMSDADLRDQYRRQAFDTLCQWRDRYRDIEEFAHIFTEIDALRKEYEVAA